MTLYQCEALTASGAQCVRGGRKWYAAHRICWQHDSIIYRAALDCKDNGWTILQRMFEGQRRVGAAPLWHTKETADS